MALSSGAMTVLGNVVAFLTAITLGVGLLAVLDRFIGGRMKRRLQEYLLVDDVQEQVEANGEKLDQLHEDHMRTMGAQVAAVEVADDWFGLLAEELEIPQQRRPERLDVQDLRHRAHDRGAVYPGEFYRGGGPADDD